MKKNLKEVQKTEEATLDLTAAREERVKETVRFILQKMLDEKLLFDDLAYIEKKLQEHLQVFIANIVVDFTNEVDELLVKSLRHNFSIAQEKMWGKERENITLEDIDNVMKKKLPLQD